MTNAQRRASTTSVVTILVWMVGFGVCAARGSAVWASPDHERARQALQAGEIMPLDKILAVVTQTHPGQILEVELDQERRPGGKVWVYEVKGIASDGKIFKLKIDARTGEVVRFRDARINR